MDYYDKVLAGIGILMVFSTGLAFVAGPVGIIAGSVFTVSLIGHAMFINPPTAYDDVRHSAQSARTPEQALGHDASDSSLPQDAAQSAD